MTVPNVKARDSFEPEDVDFVVYQGGTDPGTTLVPDRKQTEQANLTSESQRESRISASGEGYNDFFKDTATVATPAATVETDFYQTGATVVPDCKDQPSTLVENLSLKEAMDFYKISAKTIRLRIREGKIPAIKEDGPRGPEWRVYPNGLPTGSPEEPFTTVEDSKAGESGSNYQGSPETEAESTTVEPAWNDIGSRVINEAQPEVTRVVVPSFAPELKTLMDVITKQAEKLEAANLRIGYLQAQKDSYEEEIKLLTDSQHKTGWWSRFSSWFLGKR